MGKARGKARRCRKKYDYTANRKRLYKKSKKLPTVKCEQIKEAWDCRKGIATNFSAMGLASNPNASVPVPRYRHDLDPSLMEGIDLIQLEESERKRRGTDHITQKHHVAKELEKESLEPQPNRQRLSDPEVKFALYMMEKYGEDFKAMARDPKNYYQETPKAIKRKISFLKSLRQYKNIISSKKTNDT
ncbi:PREDICTED: nucleolar protein 16-like [Priapulus caudatus]|uniref:Nucleolar protein 16 n=1 Tax=Priapulus caudatus TaxID=37621 RepID=A0ABM1DP97_PRICU|nr:PREDICTED: nucleolar protein 16-like [Priapulus caudatus]